MSTEYGEWDEIERAAALAGPAPEDDAPPELDYESVLQFVSELLAPTYRRNLGAPGLTWCPEWWRHAEAIARLDALWRAWEHLRLDGNDRPVGLVSRPRRPPHAGPARRRRPVQGLLTREGPRRAPRPVAAQAAAAGDLLKARATSLADRCAPVNQFRTAGGGQRECGGIGRPLRGLFRALHALQSIDQVR